MICLQCDNLESLANYKSHARLGLGRCKKDGSFYSFARETSCQHARQAKIAIVNPRMEFAHKYGFIKDDSTEEQQGAAGTPEGQPADPDQQGS